MHLDEGHVAVLCGEAQGGGVRIVQGAILWVGVESLGFRL